MNVDSGPSTCKVVSEYFVTKTVMDDSLSDVKKKTELQKTSKNTKAKLNKGIKRIRGQKDIRTAFKGTKSELISYSKSFDRVCKKSGIDVDSEQLQLAIALSKSLQQKPDDSNKDSQNSLSSHERIRTTLLEYGFKVPEIKNPVTNKRVKRRRKNYKLLSTTDSERSQIISDRYSQVLFQNLISLKDKNFEQTNVSSIPLYYVATNITYNSIKNNEIYYVQNIIEKSLNSTTGSLLRDWSEIPGRPISPSPIVSATCFKDIECLEDNLDIFLSGSLISVKEIFKGAFSSENISERCGNIVNAISVQSNLDTNLVSVEKCEETYKLSTESENNFVTMSQYRSLSPDMFDDEDSLITESPKMKSISEPTHNITTIKLNDFVDLTACVDTTDNKPKSQLSQGSNMSDRKSNDFMEITECVATTSQPIIERIQDTIHMECNCNPDVSKTSIKNDVILEENIQYEEERKYIEHMDLTQSSDDETLPFIQIGGIKNKYIDEKNILGETTSEVETLGLTQRHLQEEKNSSISAKSPKILTSQSFFEEYVYHHSDDSDELIRNNDTSNGGKSGNYSNYNKDYEMNLTQSLKSSEDAVDVNRDIDIDLTQSSSDVSEVSIHNNEPELINVEISSYRNDYNSDVPTNIKDIEILNEESSSNNTFSAITNKSDTPLEKEEENSTNDSQSNSSQVSQVFRISDNELNYSLHKSKEAGNYSLYNLQSFNKSTQNIANCSKDEMDEDSFLPAVNLQRSLIRNSVVIDESFQKLSNSEAATPITISTNNAAMETPANSEYIIKTDQVTPMLDYDSMSTPVRNKELSRYGLKPIKRKRAIQLLTHIYNQTHPVIEVSPDIQSPSKKRKHEGESKNNNSPDKRLNSPKTTECVYNVDQSDKENILYEITNELPIIKNVVCDSEDWVFQKREKAKVRSCSLPLHIAFHNYVSCRQKLREAILRYEPVNIDLIHKQMTATGHRYDPKDLLKFMDKKCITVKTAESDSRNCKNQNQLKNTKDVKL